MAASYQDIINKIVGKIKKCANPSKIILFGSATQKPFGEVNDLDFLVIKPSSLRRDMRDQEIRKSLADIIFPMDIFVYTPDEYEKYKNLPGSFIKKALETGKTLYESK